MKKKIWILLWLLLLLLPGSGARAEEPMKSRLFLRAKIEFLKDETIPELSESFIDFAEGWEKEDTYYYFRRPVVSGETIELMRSFRIPPEWGNETAGGKFGVSVTVESAEIFLRDSERVSENGETFYADDFSGEKLMEKNEGYVFRPGKVGIFLQEFEIKEGEEAPYENGKTVLPGDEISKIVKVTVTGQPGTLVEVYEEPEETTEATESAAPEGAPIEEAIQLPPQRATLYKEAVRTGDDMRIFIPAAICIGSFALIIMAAAIYRKGGAHAKKKK